MLLHGYFFETETAVHRTTHEVAGGFGIAGVWRSHGINLDSRTGACRFDDDSRTASTPITNQRTASKAADDRGCS